MNDVYSAKGGKSYRGDMVSDVASSKMSSQTSLTLKRRAYEDIKLQKQSVENRIRYLGDEQKKYEK